MLVDLAIAVVLATVQNPGLAQIVVASDYPAYCLPTAAQRPGDLSFLHRLVGVQHDQIPKPRIGIADSSQRGRQLGTNVGEKYDPSCSQGHPFLSPPSEERM